MLWKIDTLREVFTVMWGWALWNPVVVSGEEVMSDSILADLTALLWWELWAFKISLSSEELTAKF